MKIVYFGNNVRGTVCLKHLLANHMRVVGAVGHPVSTALWGETVEEICRQENIPFYQPENVNSNQFVKILEQIDFDIAVLSGYGKIIRQPLLNLAPLGFINLHGGELPHYRGSSTSRWVLINDEKVAGISILYVDKGIDTGPVLDQKQFIIKECFDIKDIILNQLALFPPLLLSVIDKISKSEITPTIQNVNQGTYWHALQADDGQINWQTMTSRQIFNLTRAFTTPYSGAFSFVNGKKINILKSKEIQETFKGLSGRVCAVRDNGVVVIAKDRGLLIECVKGDSNEVVNAREVLKIGNYLK